MTRGIGEKTGLCALTGLSTTHENSRKTAMEAATVHVCTVRADPRCGAPDSNEFIGYSFGDDTILLKL